jgi:hypothetical protein
MQGGEHEEFLFRAADFIVARDHYPVHKAADLYL